MFNLSHASGVVFVLALVLGSLALFGAFGTLVALGTTALTPQWKWEREPLETSAFQIIRDRERAMPSYCPASHSYVHPEDRSDGTPVVAECTLVLLTPSKARGYDGGDVVTDRTGGEWVKTYVSAGAGIPGEV
ncbi:MAG: hypothetical protein ABFE08_00975 [Armatimonadia bacterium]